MLITAGVLPEEVTSDSEVNPNPWVPKVMPLVSVFLSIDEDF